jgi:Amidohydrolase family
VFATDMTSSSVLDDAVGLRVYDSAMLREPLENCAQLEAAVRQVRVDDEVRLRLVQREHFVVMPAATMSAPMQVIMAATKNAAEFLKMPDTGTLEVGKNADFIVLDANPLDDITNTRKISQVILRGAGQQAVAHAMIYPEPEKGGCSDNAIHLAAARPRKPQQPNGVCRAHAKQTGRHRPQRLVQRARV